MPKNWRRLMMHLEVTEMSLTTRHFNYRAKKTEDGWSVVRWPIESTASVPTIQTLCCGGWVTVIQTHYNKMLKFDTAFESMEAALKYEQHRGTEDVRSNRNTS